MSRSTPSHYEPSYLDDEELSDLLLWWRERLAKIESGELPDRRLGSASDLAHAKHRIKRTEEEIAERAAGRRRQFPI